MVMRARRSPSRAIASPQERQRWATRPHRTMYTVFLFTVLVGICNFAPVTALAAANGQSKPEISISSQDFSFARGVKQEVAIAIEATEIKGSDIHRAHTKNTVKPPAATTVRPLQTTTTTTKSPPTTSASKPRSSSSSVPAHTPTSTLPHTSTYTKPKMQAPAKKPQVVVSALWPFELGEELSQQELMMILVVIVSSLLLVGLTTTALWHLVAFAWLYVCEQRLLRAVARASTSAVELEKLLAANSSSMPLLMKSLVATHVRLARLGDVVDKLLETTGKITFTETELEISGLPETADDENRFQTKPMTFFHILSAIESLQCQGESVAMELTTIVVPLRWTRQMDVSVSIDTLKTRMLALRQRHHEIHHIQQRVVKALEQRHVNGEAVDYAKLEKLVAALRQTPPSQSHSAASAETSQLSSPLKLRSPKDTGKDEFGFFLRSFDKLNKQHDVQVGLERAFSKLTAVATVTSSSQQPQIKSEQPQAATATTTTTIVATASTTTTTASTTARVDASWSRTLESWVDRAEEMEMTHLDEVKRAQYLLEDAKRESFCLLNSSRDAMQSVESLKTSLVSLGADPKAAVLTAAEIYSSRSNMLLLTTTLRSAFDEFRKGDMLKMEERRRRHAHKERDKRERAVAKFRMKQHLLAEKMELQRALEREQRDRERAQRDALEREAFVRQTKLARKQFVWMVTKVDVLIVLLVMAIVFFDSLTSQLALLTPVCASPSSPSSSSASSRFAMLLPSSSSSWSSWWPPTSISLLACRVEYAVKVAGVFLAGIAAFYVVAQLHLLTTTLPVAIAAGLYYVRTEWMNMVFRLPVLLVLYGFNSLVLYLLNRPLTRDDEDDESPATATTMTATTKRLETKRRALLLQYVAFPLVSVLLSVVVGITIACDTPHECVVSAVEVTHRSLTSLWLMARHAYHL